MKLLRIPAFASEEEEGHYRVNAGWMFRFPPEKPAEPNAAENSTNVAPIS
jgi:hypothetical protein